MKTQSWGCGCFLKVYVCPAHIGEAEAQIRVELEGLRDQLLLPILDSVGSVSDEGPRAEVTHG